MKTLFTSTTLGALFCVLAWVPSTGAEQILFTGEEGALGLSASVLFEYDMSAGLLAVTLTNTSQGDVIAPQDVLTGVFFNMGGGDLQTVEARLGAGSVVWFAPETDVAGNDITDGTYDGDVGAEWGYRSGIQSTDAIPLTPGHTNSGISSTGLDDVFGPGDRFDTSGNLQGPASPDGLQYGITSEGDDPLTGNKMVTGSHALIWNSVDFLFQLAPSDDFSIADVWFQYGTSLSEPNYPYDEFLWIPGSGGNTPPVPEPASVLVLGLGLSSLALRSRKRSQIDE
jgi:PEP-CTERM motif